MYHRHEIRLAFTNLWRGLRKSATSGEEDLAEDIHFKLMKKYKETPEWWFLLVLGIAMALGMIGVGVYPSHTTPAVVIFGIIMAAICVVPVGLIASVTGIQVTMNGKSHQTSSCDSPANRSSACRVHWWCHRQGQRC